MSATQSGRDLARGWLASSPFVAHLGIEVLDLGESRARLRLPYREAVATMGDVVHGGAIGTLVDSAATAAAWAGAEVPDNLRGSTVSMAVTYLAPARGQDLVAEATVVRRGRSLVFCDVEVAPGDGDPVARALVTYKLG